MSENAILKRIGNTPILPLSEIHSNLWAKMEAYNPSGSVKDRIALFMIEEAEKKGWLKPGGTIVENSSGNTGTALAMIAAIKGYRCIITMPDKMSQEKQNLIRSYGANIVVTPTNVPADSPESYYSVARGLAQETPDAYYPDQYNNPSNIQTHFETTGPEIWAQTQGKIDILVAGIGTGGTLSGCAKFLKQKNPNIQIIGVDPIGSVFYDYFKTKTLITPSPYAVEGLGEDYLVKALQFELLDDIIQITDQQSFTMARKLAQTLGLFVGGSSGSAVYAACEVAKRQTTPKTIVTILPDSGDRYLSTFYNDDWMKEKGFSI